MDASRVAQAASDPVTQARLDACVFKGAVRNRATGEWEAVPMCAMNQSRWSELYAERLAEAARAREAVAVEVSGATSLGQVGAIQVEIFCSITFTPGEVFFSASRKALALPAMIRLIG